MVRDVWGWVCAAALGLIIATGMPARAQESKADEEARVHFRLGVAYHDSGRFQDAAQEFEQAYELSKRPELLYNLFLAYRDGGNVPKAADALRRYLAEVENPPEREKLEARLEALERILANQPATEAGPQEESTEAPPPPEVVAAPEQPTEAEPTLPKMEPNPVHKIVPWAAIGTGGAMIAVGAVMGGLAKKDESSLNSACPHGLCPSQSDLNKADSGKTKALVADVMLFGGLAVAGTGLLLWYLLPREREVRTTGSLACVRTGCAASLTHRF